MRVVFAETVWYQDLNLLSQDLISVVAKQLFNLGIDQDDFSLQVHYYHGVGRCLQETSELGFRPLAVADVSDGTGNQRPLLGLQRAQADFHGKF